MTGDIIHMNKCSCDLDHHLDPVIFFKYFVIFHSEALLWELDLA